jgi:hypothetical protein
MAAFSPRTPADEAWRRQLQGAHVAARLASRPLVVTYYDGASGADVEATVLRADAAHDDFVLRLPDGVRGHALRAHAGHSLAKPARGTTAGPGLHPAPHSRTEQRATSRPAPP